MFILQARRFDISSSTLRETKNFIEDSGCKAIRFEEMSNRAAGISKTDECVINSKILASPLEYLLYILLHEVAHQYQYTKHGKDYMLDVYLESTGLEKAAKQLLLAEKIADRFAIRKLRQIGINNPIVPRYLEVTDLTQIKNHLKEIREAVLLLGLSSIEEINDHIYRDLGKR